MLEWGYGSKSSATARSAPGVPGSRRLQELRGAALKQSERDVYLDIGRHAVLHSGCGKSVTAAEQKQQKHKKTKGSGEDIFSALGNKIKYVHKCVQITVKWRIYHFFFFFHEGWKLFFKMINWSEHWRSLTISSWKLLPVGPGVLWPISFLLVATEAGSWQEDFETTEEEEEEECSSGLRYWVFKGTLIWETFLV